MSKRKRGGQPGNKNASGNSGGGAPKGNRNALQHGGYEVISSDALSDDERDMLADMPTDPRTLVIDEIKLLTVRERRIMQRIQALEVEQYVLRSAIRNESLRDFSTDQQREEYERCIAERVERGDRLPGRQYDLTTTYEASYCLIYQLEVALTHCQEQKRRYIDSLSKIELATKPDFASSWIKAVLDAT